MSIAPSLPMVQDCTGCEACFSACLNGAIVMRPDDEGFLHPHIDGSKCIGCGACESACPVWAKRESSRSLSVYAAQAKERELRKTSSSGGVFALLARQILAGGGIVFGVRCNLKTGEVMFAEVSAKEEIWPLQGSKYVQARVGGSYKRAKGYLDGGKRVLFSGTPCQIAGLKTYLGKTYDNLITVDIVCHGVPSPLAWRRFLLQHGDGAFNEIVFRDKRKGWRKYAMSLITSDGKQRCGNFKGYTFLWGFIADLYNRRSCYHCQFRDGKNMSDLTLGDYWGVETKFPELGDESGTSLVITRTLQGKDLLKEVGSCLSLENSSWEHAVLDNPSLVHDVTPHKNRDVFFERLSKGEKFDSIVRDLLEMGFFKRLCKRAVRVLKHQ